MRCLAWEFSKKVKKVEEARRTSCKPIIITKSVFGDKRTIMASSSTGSQSENSEVNGGKQETIITADTTTSNNGKPPREDPAITRRRFRPIFEDWINNVVFSPNYVKCVGSQTVADSRNIEVQTDVVWVDDMVHMPSQQLQLPTLSQQNMDDGSSECGSDTTVVSASGEISSSAVDSAMPAPADLCINSVGSVSGRTIEFFLSSREALNREMCNSPRQEFAFQQNPPCELHDDDDIIMMPTPPPPAHAHLESDLDATQASISDSDRCGSSCSSVTMVSCPDIQVITVLSSESEDKSSEYEDTPSSESDDMSSSSSSENDDADIQKRVTRASRTRHRNQPRNNASARDEDSLFQRVRRSRRKRKQNMKLEVSENSDSESEWATESEGSSCSNVSEMIPPTTRSAREHCEQRRAHGQRRAAFLAARRNLNQTSIP